MAKTVSQPSYNPTNKLSSSQIATGIVALVAAAVTKRWPEYSDPAIWLLAASVLGLIVGYFVPDKPNVEVADD